MEKRALGKGISALIPEREVTEKEERVVYLKPEQIKPSSLQPRKDFDQESLEELMQSVREKGVIQPLLVRRHGDAYELIAGERRLRAAEALHLKEIPAIVKNVEDEDSLELALIENIQRQNLNPIEEARAYQYLIDKFHLSQERVSEVLGKARVSVTNTLRLLKLPQEIQEDLRNGKLSFGHGKALLEIDDINRQRRLAQEAISKGLSVRELENLVKSQRHKIPKQKIRQGNREPYLAVIEEELQHRLATKVRITKRNKRGHIAIEFYSPEDLERITRILRGVSKT
jgi:ParB family chromosome partitioning protein